MALAGVAVVTALFICSIQIQTHLGGEKGQTVSQFMLPVLAMCAVMAVVALVRPGMLGSTVLSCGRLVQQLLGRVRPDGADVVSLLGWVVKAVFLPLMLAWSLAWIANAGQMWQTGASIGAFSAAMALLYAIDTAFGTVGYLSTSERIDAHIRSVDSTLLGWLSALACYPPLSVVVLETWLVYKSSADWTGWFAAGSVAAWFWGGAILVLTAIYTWSTVVFGPRFSNLTHRGIITSGPYRWGKHPAYVAKNASWWLISVPFLGHGTLVQTLLHCLALLAVNMIYAVRAYTEERHLRIDPDYRRYAGWIARNGWLARVRRAVGGHAGLGRAS
ncbi:methyltransferase family protein [Stenotrophomonas rhizophila]|uniref:methyltransferase family protein n=1 Tax=Stenotrophomonas rhizophila TaxID=216778 RepID=UPI0013754554|nr:isoprenylcysteine carboxylmethyltransferase family protein [Stenotrophomonas rhizophila]